MLKGKGMQVDQASPGYPFCPGKATWFPWLDDLFDSCRVALEAGILPREGGIEDQDELFGEAFPAFIGRWRHRRYEAIWEDVRAFTKNVLESVLGKKKGR